MKKGLRSGFTTGACATACVKSAVLSLLLKNPINQVQIPLKDGNIYTFKIHELALLPHLAFASVIKDAGDDPDVTNGAEIFAKASIMHDPQDLPQAHLTLQSPKCRIILEADEGVGIVTKPGLPVPVGCPAINPVPQSMILQAVVSALDTAGIDFISLKLSVGVKDGLKLASKTLNSRLGIIGGLSILGTTGIVRPLSADAWTATITASMDVAKAMGLDEIVLSTGRTSELAIMKQSNLPSEAFVMMGDFVEFAVKEAVRHGFTKITLSAQWAKLLKIAMSSPHTHVRYGALDIDKAVAFVAELTSKPALTTFKFNTARELFDWLLAKGRFDVVKTVIKKAQTYLSKIVAREITVCLVGYDGKVYFA